MTGSLLRPLRPALGWATALALLALAWHLKHPLMVWLRGAETPLLVGAGLGGGAWALAHRSPPGWHRINRRLLGTAFLAVAVLALYRELEFARERAEALAATPLLQAVGGHFIVGFTDFAAVEPLATRGLIGGLYLTRRNLKGSSVDAVAAAIARLQATRREAGLPPLIVAADQEGGDVSHLSPWLTAMPPLASLVGPEPPATIAARARAYGRAQGAELAALGINLNFGPVVDLRPADSFAGDRLTRIARRAIAADPALVTAVARGYAAGLAEAGVGATLKHFPGLGRVRADTHFTRASLPLAPEELATDWLPFRETGGEAAIMVGHVTLPAVDGEHAASHSQPVIQGLLRQNLGYGGLVVTDDLNMGAVYGRGIGRVAGEALAAGADLVLVSYDPDQYFRALHGAAAALARGDIDAETLVASRRRIDDFFRNRRPSPPQVEGATWAERCRQTPMLKSSPFPQSPPCPCASCFSISCRKARPAWTTSSPAATARPWPPLPAGWRGNGQNFPSACGARRGPAAATC